MKQKQLDVAIAFFEGKDVFAILSTGFGKSLCYACLSMYIKAIHNYIALWLVGLSCHTSVHMVVNHIITSTKCVYVT